MTEAEVSLRLAMCLSAKNDVNQPIRVSIDGAHVQIEDREIFPLRDFMVENGWSILNTVDWRGVYTKNCCRSIEVHSTPGEGDVTAKFNNGKFLRVESKKGPLSRSTNSVEYPLMREAIGQLMTIPKLSDGDLLSIAVPDSERFKELTVRWREAPLIIKMGLRILLVNRDGKVDGLTTLGIG
jgi:hypothetical protein